MTTTIEWLLNSPEPWTRYHTLTDLLSRPESDPGLAFARKEMLAHPQVRALMERAATWGETPLKRHNDASHPIYALSTLADFGLRVDDPGMAEIIEKALAHQSAEGAFQTVVNIPRAFGGDDTDHWTWIACDAPTLLYALASFGLVDDGRVVKAAEHLAGQAAENGYRCSAAPELGKFRGPGRKDDPCPVANVYALKALSLFPQQRDGPAAQAAAEALLSHWDLRREKKYYLFGMGTDFAKLKYPNVFFDILHVLEALSRCGFVRADRRYREMLAVVTAQADAEGRYTASSMYQAWKGWSFADKKVPSPWLTFRVHRIVQRAG
ncbi:MAG: hypothetical protein AB1531_04405 [Chloroflexota bacterium]